MLRKIKSGWFMAGIAGAVCGFAFFSLYESILPAEYVDFLLVPFGLQFFLMVIFKNDTGYLVATIIHFVSLFLLVYWLIQKKLTRKQWMFVLGGYAVFDIIIFAISYGMFIYLLSKGIGAPFDQN